MLRGIWHTNLCLRGCEKTVRRALCFSHPENRGIIQTESPYFVRCVYYTTAATVIAKKIIQIDSIKWEDLLENENTD